MTEVGFRLSKGKVSVVCGNHEKDFSKDVFVEICQLILENVSAGRDYTSITSATKLIRTINLECEPDESEDDADSEPEPEQDSKVQKRSSSVPPEENNDDSESEEEPKPVKALPKRNAASAKAKAPAGKTKSATVKPVTRVTSPPIDSDSEDD